VRWPKFSSFGFFSLPFCVGKKPNVLNVRRPFTMNANGQRYAQYGVSKPLPYQDVERLKRATDAELRCNPRIAYDRMLPPGVYSLSISYLFFITQNPFNRSTAVSEKISF
jgi:hypothetical protein